MTDQTSLNSGSDSYCPELTLDDYLNRLQGVVKSGDEYKALCPAHDDHNPSLSIRQGDTGKPVLYCHVGCSYESILTAMGINRPAHLKLAHSKKIVATYDYCDEHGQLLYQKVRLEPKSFYIRRQDAYGGWINSKGDTRPVLYRLPDVLKAKTEGKTVFIVEGEKDVDRLRLGGLTATTNIDGASEPGKRPKWNPAYTDQIAGCSRVVILPDNDPPGKAHAEHIAQQLTGRVDNIRMVALPGLPPKGDVSDWLNAGHTIAELLEIIEATEQYKAKHALPERYSRPSIEIRGGELPAMTDAAERALLADTLCSTIYQRDVQLVRAIRTASDSITGHILRQAGSLRIVPVDSAYLLERFTQAAEWLKFDARSEKWKPTDAPKAVVDTYLARVGRWNCPALTGIIESPTLRPDGSILDKPGYDPKTGLIFDPGATSFEPIPENPTLEDARSAVQVLREVIKDFPFVAEHDEAVVLAAIPTALVRKSLRSAPLFGFSAPVMASGKSLLADSVALIATGRRAPAWTYTGDPDEERKHITSALLAGDPVACIDNVSAPLDSDRMCSVLTQETIRDRLLGSMKEVTLSTACLWMATGNNLEIRGDLSTRALVCKLDAKQESPEEREFQVNLLEWIPANRASLVTAALTILRAYHVAGRPKQPIKQFGRFETWSEWVRSAMVWAGVVDPCKARIQVAAADPARQQLTALLTAWYDAFKDQSVTTAEVIKAARVTVTAGEETYATQGGEALRQALLTVAGHGDTINPRIFGRYLAKHHGRIMNGHTLEEAGTFGNAQKWQVQRVENGVSGVSGVISVPFQQSVKKQQTDNFGEGAEGNSRNSINSTEPPPQDDGYMDSLAESMPPITAKDQESHELPRPTAPLSPQARKLAGHMKATNATGWKLSRELARDTGLPIDQVRSAAAELISHGWAMIEGDAVKLTLRAVRPNKEQIKELQS